MKMTDKEKELVKKLNHPIYSVEYLEAWIGREDNVGINAAAALQAMGAKGYYDAIKRTSEMKRSTGKKDMSGQEVFENDIIKNPYGMHMKICYGDYQAFCPADNCFMDNVGFYATVVGLSPMPVGNLEEYALVVGNAIDNPEMEEWTWIN